jgi:hypothetical protein
MYSLDPDEASDVENAAAGWLARELGYQRPARFLGPAVVFGCLNGAGEWDGVEYDCPDEVWGVMSELADQPEEEAAHVAVHEAGVLFDCAVVAGPGPDSDSSPGPEASRESGVAGDADHRVADQ